ncbi:trigger factor [Deinococcus detaillensis]|uniref:Trigger factor n=1 Tax=Deinococcus detaillensis TaxID=2592048 RepID=A0A553V423_9DEIO|nr:trigger factor [Deinococcus detaillensis]TSA87207.1 trigger factor [Deinococcus detaillensis]
MAELMSKEGNKVEFKASVPAAEVSRAYQQVWAGLSRDVRVPGFRPGKAPKKVLEQRVGAGYVENEVRERLLQVHYPQAARELKLSLVDAEINPSDLKDGQAFDFSVKGETYPEVKLGDWKQAQLSAAAPEITSDVLERTLTDLQDRNATFESVERPAGGNDMVMIEETGEEGGSYPIYLDVAEPHVQEALTGKSKGDDVSINVPAHQHGDHEHPEHTVQVKIMDVRNKQRQELGDEFAKSLNFESLERLRSDLKEELTRRAQQEGEAARREEFIEHLVSGMETNIPGALLTRRRDAMMEEIQSDLSRQGVKWAEYESFMTEQGKLDDFMADLDKNAESRVRRDLALEQLAEDTKVSVSDQEFNQTMLSLAQANNLTAQQLRTQLGPDGLNSYYANILREKALTLALAQLAPKPEAKALEADAAPEVEAAAPAEIAPVEAESDAAPSEEAQTEAPQAEAATEGEQGEDTKSE